MVRICLQNRRQERHNRRWQKSAARSRRGSSSSNSRDDNSEASSQRRVKIRWMLFKRFMGSSSTRWAIRQTSVFPDIRGAGFGRGAVAHAD